MNIVSRNNKWSLKKIINPNLCKRFNIFYEQKYKSSELTREIYRTHLSLNIYICMKNMRKMNSSIL